MAEEDATKKGSSNRVSKYADNILPMVNSAIIGFLSEIYKILF